MRPENETVSRGKALLPVVMIAGIIGSLLSWLGLQHTGNAYFQQSAQTGKERLELYASTLEAAIRRHSYLPYLLSQDPQIKSLLQTQGDASEVNHKLYDWQQASEANVLYLMDAEGRVVASSNWRQSSSFVGHSYHFRPYFIDAMAGGTGRFFAIGVTTGQPGFFLSHPIRLNGTVIGVAVVKIDMTPLEMDWASGGEQVMLVDGDGVVFLASNPAWKYRSLEPLSREVLDRLDAEQKYRGQRIQPLAIDQRASAPMGQPLVQLREAEGSYEYVIHSREINPLGWRLLYLSDLRDLGDRRMEVFIMAGLASILLMLGGIMMVSRYRGRRLLEQRVASRTRELHEANQRLLQEVQERKRATEHLHRAQEDLIQAAKLAALGQMSAGIVHEINQPLSAMQTFIASTRLLLQQGDPVTAEENLNDIEAMVRRMSHIISHLKGFASKSKGQTARVALNRVVDNALLILGPRIRQLEVTLAWQPPEQAVCVHGDEIKLEQILINLIRNALDAMQNIEGDRRLQIELIREAGKAVIQISDTGTGIASDSLPRVFDPFYTTKPPGDGLGLGLSVSYGIAREFNGDLEAENRPDGGALFRLTLEAVESDLTSDREPI